VQLQHTKQTTIGRTQRRTNDGYAYTSPFLTISGLVITLTFDLLTSKYNQFIFVSKVVNVIKLPKQ